MAKIFGPVALGIILVAAAPPAAGQEANGRALVLAEGNTEARAAMKFLRAQARGIRDRQLREATIGMLDQPAPTFMAKWPDEAGREALRARLVEAGLLDAKVTVEALLPPLSSPMVAPQRFDVAPGGTPGTHHAYPGGLAQHTAFNLRAALALEKQYREHYGIAAIEHDWVIAAPILHDAMKPWCLQWRDDGTFTTQATVGGTSSHHVFVVAEAMHRGLAPGFILALASAHQPPTGDGAAKVVAFLRAAAILAGVDAAALGLVRQAGEAWVLAVAPSLEAVIDHISDHDYVITDAAAGLVEEALARGVRAAAGPAALPDAHVRWARHRIQSRLPGLRLFSIWSAGGDAAIGQALAKANVRWYLPEDEGPRVPQPR